jgi:hypothetical protein
VKGGVLAGNERRVEEDITDLSTREINGWMEEARLI